jgi:hypothetical protein
MMIECAWAYNVVWEKTGARVGGQWREQEGAEHPATTSPERSLQRRRRARPRAVDRLEARVIET